MSYYEISIGLKILFQESHEESATPSNSAPSLLTIITSLKLCLNLFKSKFQISFPVIIYF